MNYVHAKSPCCGETIIHFGNRRRQCVGCGRTWRVRGRRRGRPRRRVLTDIIIKFLEHTVPSLQALSVRAGAPRSTFQARIARALETFCRQTPWPTIPSGSLILVADAMVKMIERKWTTSYFMLLRSRDDNRAFIAQPFVRLGAEVAGGWRIAIDTLPESVRSRIVALVCDGHGGLITEAKWRSWPLQRCHFHLLLRIQSRRSRWKIARHNAEAEAIFRHVRRVLAHPHESELAHSLNALEEIGWTSSSPEIRKVLSGFVRNYRDYRLYLRHPEWRLPTTNNTAESFISCVKSLRQRARGFRTLRSLMQWTEALIKHKRFILCNGHQPN